MVAVEDLEGVAGARGEQVVVVRAVGLREGWSEGVWWRRVVMGLWK